jgi:hypothetical protein
MYKGIEQKKCSACGHNDHNLDIYNPCRSCHIHCIICNQLDSFESHDYTFKVIITPFEVDKMILKKKSYWIEKKCFKCDSKFVDEPYTFDKNLLYCRIHDEACYSCGKNVKSKEYVKVDVIENSLDPSVVEPSERHRSEDRAIARQPKDPVSYSSRNIYFCDEICMNSKTFFWKNKTCNICNSIFLTSPYIFRDGYCCFWHNHRCKTCDRKFMLTPLYYDNGFHCYWHGKQCNRCGKNFVNDIVVGGDNKLYCCLNHAIFSVMEIIKKNKLII